MSLDAAFAALADPTRRELVERIARTPQPAGVLWRGLPMSRPAVSKHLRVLREAGLVEARKKGRQQLYRLSPRGLGEVERYMARIGRFWDAALNSFKRYTEGRG